MISSVNIHDATSLVFQRWQRNDLHWLEIRANGKDGHFALTVFSGSPIQVPDMEVLVPQRKGDNDE